MLLSERRRQARLPAAEVRHAQAPGLPAQPLDRDVQRLLRPRLGLRLESLVVRVEQLRLLAEEVQCRAAGPRVELLVEPAELAACVRLRARERGPGGRKGEGVSGR